MCVVSMVIRPFTLALATIALPCVSWAQTFPTKPVRYIVPFGAGASPDIVARTLAPRGRPYGEAEVLEAVASLHTALEMPSSRFTDFTRVGEAQLIADNACAHHFILGPAVSADWRSMDLAAHKVLGTVTRPDGRRWTRKGTGAAVLGNPANAVAWLANKLADFGVTLEAGEVILPGALPTIFAGLRISLGLSLVVLVSAEFVASNSDIGYLIWTSWQTLVVENMFVGIIVVTALGVLTTFLLHECERLLIPWRHD